ncbi:MAG: hypothetical protein A2655_01985 [Candidatus Yanofskybacteria bacterium RIFCSPHIGHO2_01_FULL_43_42]|uniref:UDP-N-acetylglucosamine kinase n=1 Tax=Candidatus Yanofskybacteria bacterium RIFCSPLOWO2_01_FULL_43_22 TaxID=1802695 RepID=A0A1F8GGY7_9BACT|nr:MAG: hypothetical protein A2655_01985 [Candidatus Yanofskybacteria bacterium RIFCSPHIGHO2_01_FULL_43_42]OGN13239.1 MAG: hypothetical protein A3D48_02890 [Candidatus Yanofskybacteria bacterium RIFCSPHIGHO2_02_FULL_43_17]OGN24654.1 MAG: hypothetical protein A3A13_01115 [Candidatus Yanofskybacteria bacterium RIFCSPLOWO2_01_FULL_43_22]
MGKKLILVCGLGTTGKSYWSNIIMALLAPSNPVLIDLDEVRNRYWGDRALTLSDEEHIYKNKLTRQEVQRAFIVDRANVVIVNMTMLTKEGHQKPFMQMIQETEEILIRIEVESALKNLRIVPAVVTPINVRALWMDCDLEATRRRLQARQSSHSVVASDVLDIKVFEHGRKRFEPPDGEYYPYLRVDTSDESPEADRKRLVEIFDFVV